MIGSEEKVRWGDGDADGGDATRYGVITRKRVGRGGDLVTGLDRRGAARQFAVRDRHRTISLTATVAEGVTDDDVPEVGDVFHAPVAGREVAFVCQSCELETFVEDASILTLTGRTPGETPANAPWLPRTPPPAPQTASDAPAETHN